MSKWSKQDLIDRIADQNSMTKTDVGKVLDGFFDSVTTGLAEGNQIVIVGFGTWTTSDRAARTGRNPQTGEEIQIAASRVAKFKAGKALKDAVNS